MERNVLNIIPLMDEDLKYSAILDTTYKLIRSRKFSKLRRHLSSVQSEAPDFYLAKTLYHISKREYQNAIINLRLINDGYYTLIRDLLLIDLDYELTRLAGTRDFRRFLRDYQNLIDRYPDDEFLRKIIALRIRHIRYNQ